MIRKKLTHSSDCSKDAPPPLHSFTRSSVRKICKETRVKIYSCRLSPPLIGTAIEGGSRPPLECSARVAVIAADKDALDRGAYGSKTWDTVSTACPTQRIVDAPNRIEGNIRCAACTARLSSPLFPFFERVS